MKILVMGLPGAGKTWLAERLVKYIDNCAWFNADVIRKAANDWDFTESGRLRQANRMKTFSDFEISNGRRVVCDFVAPTEKSREQFGADIIIWLDTVQKSQSVNGPAAEGSSYEQTDNMFEKPENADYIFTEYLTEQQVKEKRIC
jgi:adenylylsulfate kinase